MGNAAIMDLEHQGAAKERLFIVVGAVVIVTIVVCSIRARVEMVLQCINKGLEAQEHSIYQYVIMFVLGKHSRNRGERTPDLASSYSL